MQKRFRLLLVIMVVLSPIGLLAEGTAWGEWGSDEIKEILGFVPHGMQQAGGWWKAALPDYSIAALGGDVVAGMLGYILSAVLGAGLSYGVITLLGKRLMRAKAQAREVAGKH